MTSMYGHKWTSAHGVDVDSEGVWSKALTGVSPRKIGEGMSLLTQKGEEWPPSAPQFRKMCLLGEDTPAQKAFKAQARMNKGLPILPATKEFARDQLKKIREGLK